MKNYFILIQSYYQDKELKSLLNKMQVIEET